MEADAVTLVAQLSASCARASARPPYILRLRRPHALQYPVYFFNMSQAQIEAQLLRLVRDYQDMNGAQITALDRPPTALEFSQMVALSRPVVFRTGVEVPDSSRWTTEYLAKTMGDRPISVSVTPDGNADALREVLTEAGATETYFVEPLNEHMPLRDFLHRLEESTEPERASDPSQEVLYLQSQNGNIYSPYDDDPEYALLQADVPSTLPWASEALGQEPDAVNLWIGSSRSRTSLHKDPYENVYAVVSGTKTFTVLPPVEGVLLGTKLWPHASWTRSSGLSNVSEPILTIKPSPSSTARVPWTGFDPTTPPGPPTTAADRTRLTRPLTINVPEGFSLYLPAMWYHHVTQSPPSGFGRRHEPCIALNWWFDQSYAGERAVVRQFVEGMARTAGWIEDGWQADDDDEDDNEGKPHEDLTPAARSEEMPGQTAKATPPDPLSKMAPAQTPEHWQQILCQAATALEGTDGQQRALQAAAALARASSSNRPMPLATTAGETAEAEDARRGRELVASLMSDEPPSDQEDANEDDA